MALILKECLHGAGSQPSAPLTYQPPSVPQPERLQSEAAHRSCEVPKGYSKVKRSVLVLACRAGDPLLVKRALI